jgi:hypothetical protein
VPAFPEAGSPRAAALDPVLGHTSRQRSTASSPTLARVLGQVGGRDVIVSADDEKGAGVGPGHGTRTLQLDGRAGPVWAVALGQLGDRYVVVSAAADGCLIGWTFVSAGQFLGGNDPVDVPARSTPRSSRPPQQGRQRSCRQRSHSSTESASLTTSEARSWRRMLTACRRAAVVTTIDIVQSPLLRVAGDRGNRSSSRRR